MASGDNLLHRGKLTKEIVQGLRSTDDDVPIDSVFVRFAARDESEMVILGLTTALESVTFDVAEYEAFEWADAYAVTVFVVGGGPPPTGALTVAL